MKVANIEAQRKTILSPSYITRKTQPNVQKLRASINTSQGPQMAYLAQIDPELIPPNPVKTTNIEARIKKSCNQARARILNKSSKIGSGIISTDTMFSKDKS